MLAQKTRVVAKVGRKISTSSHSLPLSITIILQGRAQRLVKPQLHVTEIRVPETKSIMPFC